MSERNRYIDIVPPRLTGDYERDITALSEYNHKLIERLNFILNVLYKRIGD